VSNSFDSSSLILLKNNYPEDVFPSVWKLMDDALDKGEAFVLEEVIAELAAGTDQLDQRIKKHAACIVKTDAAIETHVKAITKSHPNLIDIRRQKSLGDPYVIAVALLKGGGVVTEESDKPNKVKIPHVCIQYGRPYSKLLGYMRSQKWAF
jgi:hypothetical protein